MAAWPRNGYTVRSDKSNSNSVSFCSGLTRRYVPNGLTLGQAWMAKKTTDSNSETRPASVIPGGAANIPPKPTANTPTLISP